MKQNRFFIYLAIGVILLAVVSVGGSYFSQKYGIEHKSSEYIPMFEKRFKSFSGAEAGKITGYLELIEDRQELREAFLKSDRELLYSRSKKIFGQLNKDADITHFYFIRANGEVLLRVHDYERHSDIIDRFTFLRVKESGVPFYGLEYGIKKNYTLRVVHPWIVDNRLIGYLELGKEVDKVIETLSGEMGIEIAFAVNKSVYKEPTLFVEEALKGVYQTDSQYLVYSSKALASEIPYILKQRAHSKWFSFNNKNFIMYVTPLQDVSQKELGDILFFVDMTQDFHELEYGLILYTIIMALGTLFMLFIGFLLSKNYQQQINDSLSELEKAKQLAEEANRSKSEFLANMSHEIRTPMNGILGFVERLEKSEKEPDRLKQFRVIRNSGQTLLTIINDILDFSKIESGKMSIERSPLRVSQIFENSTSIFASLSSAKNINLHKILDDNLPSCIMGDETRLKQIIFNLMNNAIKFTNEGGNITLQARYNQEREVIYIAVIDTGIGIAKENLKKIFEAFGQEDASTTRKFGGTGLGLTISARLVSLMGGELKVESAVGEGSRFYFEIPVEICAQQETQNKDNEDNQIENSQALRGHLLVVEDNKTNQMLMGIILDDYGITYDIAADGAEAVLNYKLKRYDAILMDENMPIMNGIEATGHIRELEQEEGLARIPIIAVTANAMSEDRQRFIDAGMDNYISKPYSEEDIYLILKKYLNK